MGYVTIYHPKDPNLCIVEYVSRLYSDQNSLRQAAAAVGSPVKVYEKSHTRAEDFAAVAKAAGFPDIDFEKFVVRVP